MTTKYVVIVPTTLKDFRAFDFSRLVRYFAAVGVNVQVYINGLTGPDTLAALQGEPNWSWSQDGLPVPPTLCFGGAQANPYTARNIAMLELFSGYGHCYSPSGRRLHLPAVEAVFITDLDCSPVDGLHEAILESVSTRPDTLVGGRVTTSIPSIKSPHFDSLREVGFECYDGFTAPGTMLGAAMLITKSVMGKLGTFSSYNISGGDADYALRASVLGVPTAVDPRIAVVKTIYSMTLRGMLEKQVRRGACCTTAMLPTREHLESCIKERAAALSKATTYPETVDAVLGLQFLLGQLTQHTDKVSP